MQLNSAQVPRYAAQYYNYDLLNWRRQRLNLTQRDIARMLDAAETTIRKVFQGNATNKKVYAVVHLLGLDWASVHDLTLPETSYHLAVLPARAIEPPLIAPNGSP